jgi:hypothetical protein
MFLTYSCENDLIKEWGNRLFLGTLLYWLVCLFLFFSFFLGSPGSWTQSLMLDRQHCTPQAMLSVLYVCLYAILHCFDYYTCDKFEISMCEPLPLFSFYKIDLAICKIILSGLNFALYWVVWVGLELVILPPQPLQKLGLWVHFTTPGHPLYNELYVRKFFKY